MRDRHPWVSRLVVTGVGLLAACLLLFLLVGTRNTRLLNEATPPPGMEGFEQYVAWHPHTTRFAVRVANGGEYVEAQGPLVGGSGPSCYVFDRSGRFVDWTFDSGDDPAYREKWQGAQPNQFLDREGVRKWMRGASSTAPGGG